MADFYEIDFLAVEADKSGDAIAMRYSLNEKVTIHITDVGFKATSQAMADHIDKYYDKPATIQHLVVTHNDRDHSGGVAGFLDIKNVETLWMLCPWHYAEELLPSFKRFTSVANLEKRLKEIYSNLAEIEAKANEKGIKIREPFQGSKIGEFTVMAPSKERFLDLILESEKTPETGAPATEKSTLIEAVSGFAYAAIRKIAASWGSERFSASETSAENEMSVVQYAEICGKKILLTGDIGRGGLAEVIKFAPSIGLKLPGIDKFQVPHHGSRRNLSSDLLDQLLGEKLPQGSTPHFDAFASSAKADKDHPRNAVMAAIMHRGGCMIRTESKTVCSSSTHAPKREGWTPVEPVPYPDEVEDD